MSDLDNHVVANLPTKWMKFGTQVGLEKATLEKIEKDNNGKCQECFSQTIDVWKRTKSSPFIWETVLKVLYSPAIMEYKAGEDVYSHLQHLHSKRMSTIVDA